MRSRCPRLLLPLLVALPPAVACASSGLPAALEEVEASVADAASQDWHRGPEVHVDEKGTTRFVRALNANFDTERSMETVRFTDRFYRAPANPAYDAVLDHVAERLRASGFGGEDPRLKLEFLEMPMELPAWTPVSGSLTLKRGGSESRLHGFERPEDTDRVMLPINAPGCDVEGRVAMHLDELEAGMILVTDVTLTQVMRRATSRGAAAVVSSALRTFNEDPSGQERHLDAIQYRLLRTPPSIPVIQISPRSYQAIESACLRDAEGTRLAVKAVVEKEARPLRTLVATVVGQGRPDEAVAMSSHVQEPGACDNATGVAGLMESARALVACLRDGSLQWPDRTLVFLWGDEFRQTSMWLDATEKKVVAGISSDMTGQSADTGAIALLERMPDPGALVTLDPDVHTPWGAGDVSPEDFAPNGLAVIARCAMIDVGRFEEGGWKSADHPWEGGSDHDVFIERGIPAVLFWHFTDFTYHTSLDRLPFVDPHELRRTAVALLSTALGVADPQPSDLDRYARSLSIEENVRVAAAMDAGDEDLAALWQNWSLGARAWLRNHCLGIDEGLPQAASSQKDETER